MEEQKEPNLTENEAVKLRKIFFISSKKKWFWVGIFIALINPIFSGFIIAAFYLGEPDLKKEGIIIAGVAILWGVISFYFLRQNFLSMNFSF